MRELALRHVSQPYELSLLLVTFAVVIFMGILGLSVVVVHRQKRKRQLKALLRAKNLGPVLESREIARSTGLKHYPQYVRKNSESTNAPNPDIETSEEKKMKKLDINDLLAAIMIRMRNRTEASFRIEDKKNTQETSFYYKDSSLSTSNEESGSNCKNAAVQVHNECSSSSSGSERNSYVSRISQQVFVEPEKSHLKTKVASFFSSVSKYKSNTKL